MTTGLQSCPPNCIATTLDQQKDIFLKLGNTEWYGRRETKETIKRRASQANASVEMAIRHALIMAMTMP